MLIPEIIESWLAENGYDGLCFIDGDEYCGCGNGDLTPCGSPHNNCQAAYKLENGNFGPVKKRRG